MGDSKKQKKGTELTKKIIHSYPFIKFSDMGEEMKAETMDVCVAAYEKYNTDHEKAAKLVKEHMDRKFGCAWHVVVGEAFGMQVTHETQNMLYMFLAGNQAICVWKCL